MYMPSIKEAKPLERIRLGAYDLVFLGEIESVGAIQYKYILVVYNVGDKKPIYFVSSEANALAGELGGGSHFLCAFEGEGHVNFGCSDEWADYDTFADRALRMVKEKFKLLQES